MLERARDLEEARGLTAYIRGKFRIEQSDRDKIFHGDAVIQELLGEIHQARKRNDPALPSAKS